MEKRQGGPSLGPPKTPCTTQNYRIEGFQGGPAAPSCRETPVSRTSNVRFSSLESAEDSQPNSYPINIQEVKIVSSHQNIYRRVKDVSFVQTFSNVINLSKLKS